MNDLALNIFISAISGIAVTILGFIFGEVATKQREDRQKKEQQGAVRTLLRLEIDQKLAWLDDYWQNKIEHNLEGIPDELAFQRRIHLIQEALPVWSHLRWESQSAALPLALSEGELRAIFQFHAQLERLTALRPMLIAAVPSLYIKKYTEWREIPPDQREDISTWAPELKPFVLFGSEFLLVIQDCNQETSKLWEECEGIYNRLRSRGNLLPVPARQH